MKDTMSHHRRNVTATWIAALALGLCPPLAAADEERSEAAQAATPASDEPGLPPVGTETVTVTVTVTGSAKDTLDVAPSVTVIEDVMKRAPSSAADLLRWEAGADVEGVGSNQVRPVIRGFRGLRILLLEDGLRLNNARRQTDFGEIPALAAVDSLERVELVRGPASVLYGSDAIGGVLNLVRKRPTFGEATEVHTTLGVGYRSADAQVKGLARVSGHSGKVAFEIGSSARSGSGYDAPAGDFGDIDLATSTPVEGTDLDDRSHDLHLGFQLSSKHELSIRAEAYRAGESAFGFVDPALLPNDDGTRVQILYPYQDFDRQVVEWNAHDLEAALADRLELRVYHQVNGRSLVNDIDINIGPIFPGAPDSAVEIDTRNVTDMSTWGGRVQAVKVVGDQHVLTYGAEFVQDDSENSDHSETTSIIRFPFPPFEDVSVDIDDVANTPNAVNRSIGIFIQDEAALGRRVILTTGARWTDVSTRAQATDGWDVKDLDFNDRRLVGALGLRFEVHENWALVGSWGLSFRAPNIVERLFSGPTPEGSAYQVTNAELQSETGSTWDVGVKHRGPRLAMEAHVFDTKLSDAIVQDYLSAEEVAALPPEVREDIEQSGVDTVVQQANAAELCYRGFEASAERALRWGLSAGGSFSYLGSEEVASGIPGGGGGLSRKAVASLRYQTPGGLAWVEWSVRHHWSESATSDPSEPVPPVGDTIPAFTVHQIAGGVRLRDAGKREHVIGIVLDNVGDTLYAEVSNASFFRPDPGRSLAVSYAFGF